GSDRRPRLGHTRGVALGAPQARHLSCRHRPERAVHPALAFVPPPSCRRASMRSSISSTSRSQAWPRPSSNETRAGRFAAFSSRDRETPVVKPPLATRRASAWSRAEADSSTAAPIRRPCRHGSPRLMWIISLEKLARTGFRGGLNWYRNIDRSRELLAP